MPRHQNRFQSTGDIQVLPVGERPGAGHRRLGEDRVPHRLGEHPAAAQRMLTQPARRATHRSSAGDVQVALVDVDRNADAVEDTREAEMVGMPMGDDDRLHGTPPAPRRGQPVVEVAKMPVETCIHEGDRSALDQDVEVDPPAAE